MYVKTRQLSFTQFSHQSPKLHKISKQDIEKDKDSFDLNQMDLIIASELTTWNSYPIHADNFIWSMDT